MSKVLIITTSLRAKSNSDILADKVSEGARAAGSFSMSDRLYNLYDRISELDEEIAGVDARIQAAYGQGCECGDQHKDGSYEAESLIVKSYSKR